MSELGIQPPEGKPTLPEAIPAPAPELQAAASSAPQSPAPQWSVPQPPPLPAPQPIYSRPPAFMYVEDPKSSREPQWVMWGICGFIAVMILAGGVAFVALRLGPSRATARATPPKWKPATPAPVVARPVVPARPSPRVPPQRTAVAQSFPLVSLPADRQIDLSLKTLWQTAESNGVAVRTIRTLKSTRQADVADQPVQCEMSCTFPQAVVLLSKLGTALPAWVPETFELSPTQGNALRVTMTSHMYFA